MKTLTKILVKKSGVALTMFVLSVCVVLLACNQAGLGGAVDMTGPSLEIASPNYMDNVRSQPVITGVAQDAESEIREISVILTQAAREWRAVNGVWQVRENAQAPWTNVPASGNTFWKRGGANRVDWSLEMNFNGLSERQYTVKATALDSFSNSEAQSSQSRVVIYDNTPPVITVVSPILTTAGDDNPFSAVKALLDSKQPRNPQYLSELLNDNFTFRWQIEDDVSVKDLAIQLSTVNGDVYYESIQRDITRNGSIVIPKTEIYPRGGSASALPRLYLAVLTQSYDRAGNYEWKRNGWVVWDPESDEPWSVPLQEFTTNPTGPEPDIVADTDFVGQAYDDDGVASVVLSLYRGADIESGYPITVVADGTPTSYQWPFRSPNATGSYKLVSQVTDINEKTGTQEAYFHTHILGDTPPVAVLLDPGSNNELFGDQSGNITFSGSVSDNTGVECVYIAWINPDNPVTNRAFKQAGYAGWASAITALESGASYVDSASSNSKVWKLFSGKSTTPVNFTLTLNRWTDLAYSGNFSTQTFVIYAKDDSAGSNVAVSEWATGRDNNPPAVTIDTVQVNGGSPVSITNLSLPALEDSDTLTLKGTWSDDSVDMWEDPSKIKLFKVTWNGLEFPVPAASQTYSAGTVTWTSAAVRADSVAGSLKIKESPAANVRAEIIDLAGNRTVTDESFMVETDVPQLGRISSSNESGAYNAGKTITVTLEFNKSVTWTGTDPSLTLTDTGNLSLELAAAYSGGHGTSKINFTYTVAPGVNTSGSLDVKQIHTTPNQITSNGKAAVISLPSGLNSLAGGKSIVIDTTPPTITSVSAITSAGTYPAGRTLNFTVVTSESVTVSAAPVLKFNNSQQSDQFFQTAGNTLLFSLTTVAGKDTPAIQATGLSGVITDDAGNQLSPALPNAGIAATSPVPVIAIDTQAPAAPTIAGISDNAIYFDKTHTFTITGETGAKIEYTVNGTTWNTDSGTAVSLGANGAYTIKARQTDAAGNVSLESASYAVTVDAGLLLTKISSPQNDGTYKDGQTISIDLYTRKPISISGSPPSITLNIANGGNSTKSITGATAINPTAGSSTQWRFAYTVAAGDQISGGTYLEVTGISAASKTITASGVDVTNDFNLTGLDSAMRLENQKKFRVLTGVPAITAATLTPDSPAGNEYVSAMLELTFNRPVYKGAGTITLTQDTGSYLPPAVLTPAQYAKAGGSGALGSYYTYGVNGAKKTSYAPDLTGKYVLNYDKNPSDVKTIFTGANMHVVTIPASSSAVAIANTDTAGTVTISLSGSYAVPTFGANYSLTVPEDAFKDEFNTGNGVYNTSCNLGGVNKPVIRVQKEREKFGLVPNMIQVPETLWWVQDGTGVDSVNSADLISNVAGDYAKWGKTETYWQMSLSTTYTRPGDLTRWIEKSETILRKEPNISKQKKVGYILGTRLYTDGPWNNWIKDPDSSNPTGDLEWGTENAVNPYTGTFYFDPTSGDPIAAGTWAVKVVSGTATFWVQLDPKGIYYTEPTTGDYQEVAPYYVQYDTRTWTSSSSESDGNRTSIKVTINKGQNSGNVTKASQPQQASVKIDCQTPGAAITYATSEVHDSTGMGIADNTSPAPWVNTFTGGTNAVIRLGLPDHSTSDPSDPGTPYATGSTLQLGNADYNALKVKLIVQAEKSGAKAYAYESANKTVVEFRFTATDPSGDYAGGGGRDIGQGEKLWIQGGDSPSGTSGIPDYPLSWDNTRTGMHLMTGLNESTPAATTWYWVSWEISAITYIGFAAGPTDAESQNGQGPYNYSVAIEGWSPYKEAYALYAGEKRVLRSDRCARSGNVYINGQGRGVFGFTTVPTPNR